MQRKMSFSMCALTAAAAMASLSAHGANRTWVGGNNDWDSNPTNWSPADEPDSGDAALFSTSVSVDLANADETINGLTMAGGAVLDLNGNDMTVDGLVQLSATGTFLIVPTNSLLSPDAVIVNAGATLGLRGGTVTINEETGDALLEINAGGILNGSGAISFSDAVTPGTRLFINDGTLNAAFAHPIDAGGSGAGTLSISASDVDSRLDLDGDDEAGVVSVSRNDRLDINVPLSDSFGGVINLAEGATLDMSQAWSASGADINVNTEGVTPGTAGAAAMIAGGALTQTGGSINIKGGTLVLDGGAVINAAVTVTLQVGGGIQGFGTISADVNVVFGDSPLEMLLADNGVLAIGGDFHFVALGTADDDGILEVTHDWNTVVTNGTVPVTLNGGELRGGDITHDLVAGIQGHGLISARVINNSTIRATGGGRLVLETDDDNNDWDGDGTGILGASSADLELRDDGPMTDFGGQIFVNPGREAFTNGFGLRFLSSSTLDMRPGSRYRSTGPETWYEGAVMVNFAGVATLNNDGVTRFLSGSQTTLTGDLMLDHGLTIVSAGAAFAGGGALINAQDSTLHLSEFVTAADLGVLVVNHGTLTLGGTGLGQIGGTVFEQTTSGQWDLTISGVGFAAFDRLTLTGTAVLDGTLDPQLMVGFVPALGQAFNILSAAGGVTGEFAAINQPAGMPAGLKFDVVYSPTIAQLRVVNAPTFSADFDDDGDVDRDDLVQWHGDFGLNGESDADADGDSDGADFLAWQQQLGGGLTTGTSSTVPEPSTLPWLAMAAMTYFRQRRSTLAKDISSQAQTVRD